MPNLNDSVREFSEDKKLTYYENMIETCMNSDVEWSDWEMDFLDSVYKRVCSSKLYLTDKQCETLQDLYDKVLYGGDDIYDINNTTFY